MRAGDLGAAGITVTGGAADAGSSLATLHWQEGSQGQSVTWPSPWVIVPRLHRPQHTAAGFASTRVAHTYAASAPARPR
jgi:hypothetical protein